MAAPVPTFARETALYADGRERVCGIDEAGRGPLAGPVVAAAVVLDPTAAEDGVFEGLTDSKKLSAASREDLFDTISAHADVGVGVVDVDEIDLLNILGATMKAMADAMRALASGSDYALVDGNRMPVLPCDGEAVVKGDAKVLSIAAASVIAKVTRDRIMTELDASYPGYGWSNNAGYGTAAHMEALRRLGATPQHRRSFAPVRAVLSRSPQTD